MGKQNTEIKPLRNLNKTNETIKKFNELSVINKLESEAKKLIEESVIEVAHYTSFDGLKAIITNKSIYFGHYMYLNDKDELQNGIKIFYYTVGKLKQNYNFKSQLSNQLKSLGDRRINYNTFSNRVKLDSSFYILSCSLDNDNKDMWFYYTKNDGLGYNLIFNSEKFIENTEKLIAKKDLQYRIMNGKVIYDEETQKNKFNQFLSIAIKEYEKCTNDAERQKVIDYTLKNGLIMSLFMKKQAFNNEKEYRIIISCSKLEINNITFIDKYGAFTPKMVMDIDTTVINTIKISPYVKIDYAEKGLNLFLKQQGLPNVKVENSDINIRY